MNGNNSNQNSNIFDENFCIKCRDPKSGQEELSMVTSGLRGRGNKLIQYTDFI